MPRASGLEAKLRAVIPNADVELIRGRNGVYTVIADGTELWNKHRSGDFPDEDALVEQIRKRA